MEEQDGGLRTLSYQNISKPKLDSIHQLNEDKDTGELYSRCHSRTYTNPQNAFT